jgi:adenylyltransferase/sulfurtransferase
LVGFESPIRLVIRHPSSVAFSVTVPHAPHAILEITVEQLATWLGEGRPLVLLDVREPWENALAALPSSTLVPLGELPDSELDLGLDAGETPATENTDQASPALVVYCHHGVRSLHALAILHDRGSRRPMYSLSGGIDAWSRRIDPSVPRY